MPIVVESLTDVTYQDQQDLQKIYSDAPTWLLEPFNDASQLITVSLDEGSLLAGRFNDRLLGAARLHRQPGVWLLSQLCVRKVTRRRGVAERIVAQAQELARQNHATLRLLAPAGLLEAQALAGKLQVPLATQ